MSENNVLRGWKRQDDGEASYEELLDIYCLLGTIRDRNLRRMKLVGNVERAGDMRNAHTYF
jgi:hypothetical protein